MHYVIHSPTRQCIGILHGLEKCYNIPANVAEAMIRMTRQEAAVDLWNLPKHEKDLRVAQLLK